MRILLFMLFAINCFALNDVSKPFNFSAKDTMKATRFNANYDTLYNRINQDHDSLDKKFIRFYDLSHHDSILPYVGVDSIRSGPDIDTIKGNTRFTGSPTVAGSVTATGGFAGAVTGAVTGNVTGNVTGSISGGTVAGSTGTFTSTVSVDSLKSTKGVNATGGTFSARITATDVQVTDSIRGVTGVFTGAVSGTTGTFSSTASVDSLKSTKGVNATIGVFSGKVTTARDSTSDVIATDSIKGATGVFTSLITSDSSRSTKSYNAPRLSVDSLKIGSGKWLTTYDTGSFACTLSTSHVTVQQVSMAKYIQIGAKVTVRLPVMTGVSNSTTLVIRCGGIPSSIIPTNTWTYGPLLIINNGACEVGIWLYTGSDKSIAINRVGLVFTSTGTKGIGYMYAEADEYQTIEWILK